jgi:hypothetical protein
MGARRVLCAAQVAVAGVVRHCDRRVACRRRLGMARRAQEDERQHRQQGQEPRRAP